jgi:hypothetical protein
MDPRPPRGTSRAQYQKPQPQVLTEWSHPALKMVDASGQVSDDTTCEWPARCPVASISLVVEATCGPGASSPSPLPPPRRFLEEVAPAAVVERLVDVAPGEQQQK